MHSLLERRYVLRLFNYVWAERRLLMFTVASGTLGFLVTFMYPWLIGLLIDRLMSPAAAAASLEERAHLLVWITVAGLLTPFGFALAGYGRGHFNVKLGNRIIIALRKDLFEHLQRLSLQFYSRQRTGTIVARLLHDVHGVNGLVHGGLILAFIDLLQITVAYCLLLSISTELTAAISLILPCYILTFRRFNPLVRDASRIVQEYFGRLAGNLQEQFSGVVLTKAFAAEQREVERLVRDNEEHFTLLSKQSHLGHMVGATSEFFIHAGTGIIIGVAGYLVLYSQTLLTPGQLTRFIGYVGILYGPLRRLADLNIVYQNSLAAVRRVLRIFDIEPQVAEPKNPVRVAPSRGEVRFERVYFRYENSHIESRIELDEDEERPPVPPSEKDRWVLEGIDLSVEPGEKIAVVGPSGSGKSTFVSLIPRFYDVTSGAIKIDGVDVRNYSLVALRRAIAVVHQDSFLFSSSIRWNIAYGRPDATNEQIIEAAKAANAHDFVCCLKNGYDTLLGERGVILSGGQRQRIAIARAILCNPRILILDEATSSLDAESEALVVDALDRLMVGRTSFIVAHRLSTVRNADRILTLKDGQIVEGGAHDELLLSNGIYAQLVSKQLGFDPRPGLRGGSAIR